MDVDYSNESSCNSSEISESCSSEEVNVRREVNTIQPYAFEPVETDSGGEGSGSEVQDRRKWFQSLHRILKILDFRIQTGN